MKNKVLIFVIVLLLIALGVVSVLYYNEVRNNTIDKSNFIVEMDEKYPDSIGKHIDLEYAVTTVQTQDGETDTFVSCFNGIYYYTGLNKGKLLIDDNEIKLDNIIKDICITTNSVPTYEVGKKYEFVSIMYILFDNGTLGKISTEDIKNRKYIVTIMPEYRNIDCFIETEPIEHGGNTLLWAIAKDGNVYKIDTVGRFIQ